MSASAASASTTPKAASAASTSSPGVTAGSNSDLQHASSHVWTRWGSDERLKGMTGGLHAWMNIVRADEVKSAFAAVHANDDVIALYAESLTPSDLRVLEADLSRTFDAFVADYPEANSDENQRLLKRILLCALHETGGGYCQGLNFLAGAVLLASGPELQPTADALKVSARKKAATVASYRPALALCIVKRLLKLHGFAALYSSKLIPVRPPTASGSAAAHERVSMQAGPKGATTSSSGAGSESTGADASAEDPAEGLPVVETTEDEMDAEATAEAIAASGGRMVSPLQVMSSLFVRMLELHAPRVVRHLTDSKFSAELLAIKWFTTCFARALRVKGTLMAVDAILAGIPNVLLRLGAGLLLVLEKRILRMTQDDLMTQLTAAVQEADVVDAWEKALQLPASLIQGEECGDPAPWERTMFGHHALKGKLERSGKSAHWVTMGKPALPSPPSAKPTASAKASARPAIDRSSPEHQERMRRIRRALRRALLKASAVSQFRAAFSSEDAAAIVEGLRRGSLHNPSADKAPPLKEGVALASAAHRPSMGLVMDALLAMHAGTLPSHEQLRLFSDTEGRLVARPSSAAELLPLAEHEEAAETEPAADGTSPQTLDDRREIAADSGKPTWAIDACDPRSWGIEPVRDGSWRRWCEVSLDGVLVEDGVGWYFVKVRVAEAVYESVTKHRFSHFDKLLARLRSDDVLKTLSSTLEAMGLEWPGDIPDYEVEDDDARGAGAVRKGLFEAPETAASHRSVTASSSPAIAGAAAAAAATAAARGVDPVSDLETPPRNSARARRGHHRVNLSARTPDSKSARGHTALGGLSAATSTGSDGAAGEKLPNLPPKTWFGHSPVRHSFLTRRGAQLCDMVQQLLDTPFVAKHPQVTQFFGIEWAAIQHRALLPAAVRSDLWKCADWCWSEEMAAMQRSLAAIKDNQSLPLFSVSEAIRLLQHRIYAAATRPARPKMPTRSKSAVSMRSSPLAAAAASTRVVAASPSAASEPGFANGAASAHAKASASGSKAQKTPIRRTATFIDRSAVPLSASKTATGSSSSGKPLVDLASPAAAGRGTRAK